jgi:hypothetical protein
MYTKFPLDNFHLQEPSTIIESIEMPTKSRFLSRYFVKNHISTKHTRNSEGLQWNQLLGN